MAEIISSYKLDCPECGAVVIVRTWSCGAQGYTPSVNHTEDSPRDGNWAYYRDGRRRSSGPTGHFKGCSNSRTGFFDNLVVRCSCNEGF